MKRRRLAIALAGFCALLPWVASAGPADSAASNHASVAVQPPVAEPAWQLKLIYTIESNQLVEAAVQERIECRVTAPDGGESAPCALAGDLVDARVLETGRREFVFAYEASAALGNYTVRFTLASTLTVAVPAEDGTAQGSFEVVAAGTAPPGGDPNGGDDGGPDGNGNGDDGPGPDVDGDDSGRAKSIDDPDVDADALRILVSTVVGSAAFLIPLAARRGGLGGTP